MREFKAGKYLIPEFGDPITLAEGEVVTEQDMIDKRARLIYDKFIHAQSTYPVHQSIVIMLS